MQRATLQANNQIEMTISAMHCFASALLGVHLQERRSDLAAPNHKWKRDRNLTLVTQKDVRSTEAEAMKNSMASSYRIVRSSTSPL
mmetsp:Transcript_11192/g.25477  ORF Transcript_11192/g.25477 Transcript_11192/m.25477 type:complete len:86 (-) Transcript_11192:1830-2087(-)